MEGRPIRIQGDPSVIAEIVALVEASPDADYVRTDQDDSGGIGADFVLETIATLIAVTSTLFFDGPIVPRLCAVLHRHPGTRISIETPTRTVSVESTGRLSEESLRVILAELTRA